MNSLRRYRYGKAWRAQVLGAALRQGIRENRRRRGLTLLAAACEKYLRAWHNEGFYEFDLNGEAFALRIFAAWLGDRDAVVWDVGAHDGEWALAARRILPRAPIHSFEIMPHIADRLLLKVEHDPEIIVHNIGLSDTPGEHTVHWNQSHDSTNSISPRLGSYYFSDGTTEISCQCTTADIATAKIPPPTIMKIDVEGHEIAVLRGAKAILSGQSPPALIQIEYGDTYLPSGSTLKDVYDILECGGYYIGRLFPNHVNFKPYEFSDDHFRMGNLIAVRDKTLKDRLS